MTTEFLPEAPCPSCGKDGGVSRVGRLETVHVRDLDIDVTRIYRVCAHCQAEFENTNDVDWKQEAYAAYRAQKGMVTPAAIRDWRKKYELTQPEVTKLLSWGEATLGRYENGALQSDAHNKALANLMDPDGLAQALENNQDAVPEVKRAAIFDKLRVPLTALRARQMLSAIANSPHPSIMTGGRKFSADRTASLVSLVAAAGEFKTKLNKLLFYTDFLSFRACGASITGLRYARIPYGPVPNDYEPIFASLATMGVLVIEPWESGDCYGEIVRSRDVADPTLLSDEERQVAMLVRDYFAGWSATKIKDFSHQEKAWHEVQTGQLISYEYAEYLQIKDLAQRVSSAKIAEMY